MPGPQPIGFNSYGNPSIPITPVGSVAYGPGYGMGAGFQQQQMVTNRAGMMVAPTPPGYNDQAMYGTNLSVPQY